MRTSLKSTALAGAAVFVLALTPAAASARQEVCSQHTKEWRNGSKTYYELETCLPLYGRVCHLVGHEWRPGSGTYYITESCRVQRLR